MKSRLGWILLAFVFTLLLVYAAASWYYSGLLIASPTSSLENARATIGDPSDYGLPEPEEVSIETGEVVLKGWYFDNPLDGNCGVQFMHGYTGTRYHSLYYAPLFWERGCDILTYDHRGHGESTPAFHTFGYYEKEDALAAYNWLTTKTGLNPENIAVGGVSYGASTALQVSPFIPEAAFILADSPYSDLDEIVEYQAQFVVGQMAPLVTPGGLLMAELRARFDVQAVSPEQAVTEADIPILLIHSETDEYTPPVHSEEIFEDSDQSETVFHLTQWGAPHAADITTDYEGYRALLNEFINRFAPNFGLPPAS